MFKYLEKNKIIAAIKDPQTAFYRFKRGNLVHSIQDAMRIVQPNRKKTEVINIKEIRIIGLRRSGNHAIINWINKQEKGVVWCLNNLPIHENPYRHRYEYPEESDPPWQVKNIIAEARGNFTKKDCLIYSYEDYSLKEITSKRFENKHDLYLGKSLVRYDVLILRDPFNLIASRLKSDKILVKTPNTTMIDLWIEYAKEFLGETNYLHNNTICVNYNEWFSSPRYRKKIATALNFIFSDQGIDEVSDYGGGSSFDKKYLQGKAEQMKVLNRWQYFSNDMSYRKLLNNKELLKLSEQIFGNIPGTEHLIE